jgi:hypothetical protein
MRNFVLAVMLVLLALMPFTASAQQRPAQAPSAPALTIEGISSAKILAIGIGAVLGVVAAEAVLAGDTVGLLGGVAGGVLAAWWYDSASTGPSRAALRQPVIAPIPARAESLALAR